MSTRFLTSPHLIQVTPAENLDLDSDETDDESISSAFPNVQDKNLSLSFIANTAEDTNDNDDIFGTSFMPYKVDLF